MKLHHTEAMLEVTTLLSQLSSNLLYPHPNPVRSSLSTCIACGCGTPWTGCVIGRCGCCTRGGPPAACDGCDSGGLLWRGDGTNLSEEEEP